MHQHICWIPLSFGLICFFILCVYVMEKGLFIHLYYDFQFICSIFETEFLFPMYSTNCSSVFCFPLKAALLNSFPDIFDELLQMFTVQEVAEYVRGTLGSMPSTVDIGQSMDVVKLQSIARTVESRLFFFPGETIVKVLRKCFSLKMTEQHGLTVSAHANLMCVKCVFRFIFSLLPSFLSPFARIS